MKKIHIDWSNTTSQTVELFSRRANFRRNATLAGAALSGLLLATQPAQAGSILVIAMENHNLTQPVPTSSPPQILVNTAAPYINSLMTPGSPNAAQTSYDVTYY